MFQHPPLTEKGKQTFREPASH